MDNAIPVIDYKVAATFPHDTASFTEGFLFHDGQLFESTGHTSSFPGSRSLFGVVDRNTGKIRAKVEIDKNKYFGEGITFLRGKCFQLRLQIKWVLSMMQIHIENLVNSTIAGKDGD